MEALFKIYEDLDREGPGSYRMTKRAFDLCRNVPSKPSILELGCGTGGATLDLARITGGQITATDVYQPFLDRLNHRARQAGLSDRIVTAKQDMGDLDFEEESFDLLWCEGAAYILGIDKAFEYWKPLLKPGGHLILSDAVWLTDDAPDEVKAYWAEGYPAMRTAEENVRAGESYGYSSLGHFTIDTDCWDTFYKDVERRLKEIDNAYRNDPDGLAIIDATRKEIDQYRKYPGLYGYEFHVFQKKVSGKSQ